MTNEAKDLLLTKIMLNDFRYEVRVSQGQGFGRFSEEILERDEEDLRTGRLVPALDGNGFVHATPLNCFGISCAEALAWVDARLDDVEAKEDALIAAYTNTHGVSERDAAGILFGPAAVDDWEELPNEEALAAFAALDLERNPDEEVPDEALDA